VGGGKWGGVMGEDDEVPLFEGTEQVIDEDKLRRHRALLRAGEALVILKQGTRTRVLTVGPFWREK